MAADSATSTNMNNGPHLSPGSEPMRVGVIGTGIAGLVTAKTFLRKGFEVVAFEKEPAIGGVWTASRTYPGLRANTAKETYSFSDYPYPESADGYPRAENVRDYLESYADHFGVREHIRFNSEVTRLTEADGGSGFHVTVSTEHATETHHFPYVVVCNGAFSTPNVPDFPGLDEFSGRIRHSSQCSNTEVANAAKVVVIGGGKSGLDCAASAAREGKTSTLIFRKAHWMVPRYLPGGTRSDLRMISRFSEAFVDYPTRPKGEVFLHGPGKPLVKLYWALLNFVVPRVLKMPPLMIPEHRLPTGFESVGQVDDFFDLYNEGRIAARRASVKRLTQTGVELDTGERLEADLIVFATGWQRDLSFLSDQLKDNVIRSGRFRLFRRILPPEEQRLAFVGYFPTLSCALSSEIAAHWASECFRGALQLPSLAEMDGEIERLENWAKRRVPESGDGIFTGPYIAHYVDDLMRDMGMPTKRTDNALTEIMGTFLPSRYASLGDELQAAHRH